MLFAPVLKDYIWGGRNLETKLGRKLPDGIIAESWEIAGHKDGTTVVENGYYQGKLLTDVLRELGLDLIGRRNAWAQERGKFPLLIKILDANRPLSVQVHPDDAYALKNEGNELGKTEMWVVLHAEKNANLILGVKEGASHELFRQAIIDGQLEPFLHKIPVKTGDHIGVPAGSLHAVMDRLLIAEIQQNSNTTYRVYDWNRVGNDGKPRPLHIEKAIDVINFKQIEPCLTEANLIYDTKEIKRSVLYRDKYFTVERVEMKAGARYKGVCDGSTLEIWGVINGNVKVESGSEKLELSSVRFTLLPAAMGEFSITSSEESQLLRVYVD